jgi:hypothetical protein
LFSFYDWVQAIARGLDESRATDEADHRPQGGNQWGMVLHPRVEMVKVPINTAAVAPDG